MAEKKYIPKKITQKRLSNIALYYLERYESSVANLRRVLKNRVMKDVLKGAEPDSESDDWIEAILKQMQEYGYLSDERFARNQVKKLLNQGKSERFIRGKLSQSGIDTELQNQAIAEQNKGNASQTDFESACRLVQKRKLGVFRLEKDREIFYKKDLGVLARAGFSYDIATKALAFTEQDEG